MLTIRLSKFFLGGFLAGVVLLAAVNLYSYSQMENLGIADFYYEFGWPFPVYQAGSILHLDQIHWCGVIANAAAAFGVGLVLGAVSHFACARRRVPS
ncbi:MAG: hypothetical protein JOZ96_28035 [Acidobacteria bacterium]|nr:hypothetical protein [Acidobacteriota bacterium]